MSINRWMDKEEDVYILCVYTQTVGYYLAIKNEISSICNNTDGPRKYHTVCEVSDKDKYHMI